MLQLLLAVSLSINTGLPSVGLSVEKQLMGSGCCIG